MPDFRPHSDTSRHPNRQMGIRYSDTIKTGGRGTGQMLGDIDAVLATPPEGRPERPASIFDKGGVFSGWESGAADYDRAEQELRELAYEPEDMNPAEIALQMQVNRYEDLSNKNLDINDYSSYEIGAQGDNTFPWSFAIVYDRQQKEKGVHSYPSAYSQFKDNEDQSNSLAAEGRLSQGSPIHPFYPTYSSASEANRDALDYQASVVGNRRVAKGYGGQAYEDPRENL